jgi:aminoglycoside phosphotransferase (APT) family kinase protein
MYKRCVEIFHDIKSSSEWKGIVAINKGFSMDLKYSVTKNDNRYFLRILDDAVHAQKLISIINNLVSMGVSTPRIVESGSCDEGKRFYILQDWVRGLTLENILPSMSPKDQYLLGVRAGKELLKIHSMNAIPEQTNWMEKRVELYENSLKK